MSILKFLFASFLFLNISMLSGEEVLVRTPSGENITVHIEAKDTFTDVMKSVEGHIKSVEQSDSEQSIGQFLIDYMCGDAKKCRKSHQGSRDYYRMVNPSEKEDITYVLKSLAKGSWAELLRKKSSLEKAGDRFDHIHPLRFLQFMLKDEKLKAYLYGILEGSSRVRREFFDKGLYDNLTKETNLNNMKDEFVTDFANSLQVDPNHFLPLVRNRQWDEFINTIVRLLPRAGDTDRHGRQ